jgi:hypothetical protein
MAHGTDGLFSMESGASYGLDAVCQDTGVIPRIGAFLQHAAPAPELIDLWDGIQEQLERDPLEDAFCPARQLPSHRELTQEDHESQWTAESWLSAYADHVLEFLPEPQVKGFEAHLYQCHDCSQKLGSLVSLSEHVKAFHHRLEANLPEPEVSLDVLLSAPPALTPGPVLIDDTTPLPAHWEDLSAYLDQEMPTRERWGLAKTIEQDDTLRTTLTLQQHLQTGLQAYFTQCVSDAPAVSDAFLQQLPMPERVQGTQGSVVTHLRPFYRSKLAACFVLIAMAGLTLWTITGGLNPAKTLTVAKATLKDKLQSGLERIIPTPEEYLLASSSTSDTIAASEMTMLLSPQDETPSAFK